jgi:hypothetical protein
MPANPLKALLELVRAAACEGTAEALLTRDPAPSKPAPPLLDKGALAHPLGVSTATVDRLCREGRVPYVVGPYVGPTSLRIRDGHQNRQAP